MNSMNAILPLLVAVPMYGATTCDPEPVPGEDWDSDGVPAELDCDDHSDRIGQTDWTVGGPDSDFDDIQSAVDAASPGDEICVTQGQYAAPLTIDKPLTLWAGDRGAETIINGSVGERAVTIVDAPGAVLTGFIIRGAALPEGDALARGGAGVLVLRSDGAWIADNYIHGNIVQTSQPEDAAIGGGLAVLDSNGVQITGNRIIDNQAYHGGGVAIAGGSQDALLHNNALHLNRATAHGGAVYLDDVQATHLAMGEISENTAHRGGGVFAVGGDVLTFSELSIERNTADMAEGGGWGDGGGVWAAWVGQIDFNRVRFEDNLAGQGGGVMIHDACDNPRSVVTVREGDFLHNTGLASGGGMYVECGALFTIEDQSHFEGNEAGGRGGAVFTYGLQEQAFIGGGFLDNTADQGGALKVDESGQTFIRGVHFEGNLGHSDGGGAQIYGGGDLEVSDCQFLQNAAGNQGGGLALWGVTGASLIQDTEFDLNTSDHMGAGLHLGNSASATVARSIFEGNQATGGGAGLTCTHDQGDGWFTIDGSEFANNSPTDTACFGCGSNGSYCQ